MFSFSHIVAAAADAVHSNSTNITRLMRFIIVCTINISRQSARTSRRQIIIHYTHFLLSQMGKRLFGLLLVFRMKSNFCRQPSTQPPEYPCVFPFSAINSQSKHLTFMLMTFGLLKQMIVFFVFHTHSTVALRRGPTARIDGTIVARP